MSLAKQRVKSANYSQEQQPKRRYDKVQTENSQEMRPPSPASKVRSYSRNESRKSKVGTRGLAKQPEQVAQENLNLKMFINDLQEQLSLQRGKLEMNKRKTQKYVKQLNRQFDKQLYYSGKNPHAYMFSGIKQQYENIKHLYELKCQEVEQYAMSMQYTSIQELMTYVNALEDDNKLLQQKLEEFYNLREGHANFMRSKQQGHDKPLKHSEIQRLYTEFDEEGSSKVSHQTNEPQQQQQYNFQQRSQSAVLTHYKLKASESQKEIVELRKKVAFLEQLVIEKDNNEHHAKREMKKVEKEKYQRDTEIRKLKDQLKDVMALNDKIIKSIIDSEAKKFEVERDIFKRALTEKNQHIGKLEKEVRFLSTMLSYWKPLDELNRNDFALKQPSEREDYSELVKIRGIDQARKHSFNSQNQMGSEFLAPHVIENQQDRSFKSNREEQANKKASAARSQSQQNVASQPSERLPQSCLKKWKNTAVKCRRVQILEIKGLGELLRYRLIGNNVNLDQVKTLFDLGDCPEEDRQFRTEFISMREVKDVLQKTPFQLTEPQATLVARYVVEDEVGEFVYWDEDNQIKRTIAKSIIKTLIGDYQLPNLTEVGQEWEKLKAQYQPNIQSALKIIAPKGIIAQTKFLQLLVGLGIEMREEFKDWLIAAMVTHSTSLKQLNYRTLIPLS